jgi:outer membrane protein TolC
MYYHIVIISKSSEVEALSKLYGFLCVKNPVCSRYGMIALVIFSSLAARADAAAQLMDFEKALQMAYENSPELKRTGVKREQAELDVKLVDEENDPKVTLQTSVMKQDPEPSRQTARNQSYGLTLSYDLWDFGRSSAKEKQFTHQAEASGFATEELKEQIFWKVARAYQSVIAAVRIEQVMSEQVELMETRFKQQRRDYQQGLRPELDLVTSEVDLGRSRLNHQKARDDVVIAQNNLVHLLGCSAAGGCPDPTAPWIVKSARAVDPTPATLDAMIAEYSHEAAAPTAGDKRREAQQAVLVAEKAGIDASKRPTLSLLLTAQESGAESVAFSDLNRTYSGAVQLSWLIPWNSQRKYELEKVALKQQDVEIEGWSDKLARTNQRAAALVQIKSARGQLMQLHDQYQLLVRKNRLVKNRYEGGKATIFELSSSEVEVVNLRLDQIRLFNSFTGFLLDMAEVTGKTDIKNLFD